MVDYLFSQSVTLFEETFYDANPDENLQVMLCTLGDDGETAPRLVHQAESRCKRLDCAGAGHACGAACDNELAKASKSMSSKAIRVTSPARFVERQQSYPRV